MTRRLVLALLCTCALSCGGCGGHSGEIPAKKVEEPKMNAQQSADKAMQGMPPEIKAKMGPQMQRMMQQQGKR